MNKATSDKGKVAGLKLQASSGKRQVYVSPYTLLSFRYAAKEFRNATQPSTLLSF
ncbi:MAG: hypothetical protein ABJP45_05440 [Cyclobacteriaceae bacterium]